MILAILAIALSQAAPPPTRALAPNATIRGSLAGGESVIYALEVPADQAARITVQQEDVDVSLTLRPEGVALVRGLDLTSGPKGSELAFVPVSSVAARWNVRLSAILPRAARGDYLISVDMMPADDHARALAAAYHLHHQASDTGWGGDGPSFQKAQTEYAEAAAAALSAGDVSLAAESNYQGARVHDSLGDYLGAIELQQRALEQFRALGRRDREARVLNRLGDLSRKIGEVTAAERFFKQALPLAREVDDPVNIADILNNSGLLMLSIGRVEEAIDQLQSAIPLAQQVNSANVEAALTMNLGDGYSRVGMFDKAIETYRRGVEVVRRLNIPRRTARSTTTLAGAYFENGDRASAEAAITTALDLYEQSGDRSGQAETRALYGRMLHANGETDRALALFAQALPVLHDAQSRLAEATVLTTWADVEIDRGALDSALAKADDAVRISRSIANPIAERRALYTRALALQKQGRLDEAIQAIAAVTEGAETMRGAIQRTELRTSYLAKVRSYFDLHIDLLQRQGATRAAFEVSERARARSLLDGLAESASKIEKGVDPQLLARQRQVQADLNAKEIYRAQVALRDGEKSARALAVSRDLDRLVDDWNKLRAQIRSTSPAYAALHVPEPVTLDRVQHGLLDDDTTLVEYHVGAIRSYAWVIDRRSITVHELAAAARLDEVARTYHDLLSSEIDAVPAARREKFNADIAARGRRVAALAWKPIEARVRGKRVLIVADGVLQYVPFAALPASSGEPLITRHDIVYLPSASVLESIRSRSRPLQANPPTAIFADPVFSKNDPRFLAQRENRTAGQARGSDDGTAYARLRFSRAEAEAISSVAPGVFEALDFDAAKPNVTGRDLRSYRILHFATHGSLNAVHPELSGIVLSLVDKAGKPVDGFLRLHEIYNLNLDADLVVLSACRTALGKEVHGEGLIGLTRGFMYAGAARVVSSVWNVDDRASAQLMARFYGAMVAKKLSPASALREAQLSMLREPRWANPHYWAAFGLQGDWK